ncbi:hypothetical protein [Pseudomonas cichorii]|uniref:hypothetical protein n=1 Tax=Pseudomonas cichorii TaxID=36746 RepID=UPI001C8ABD3E|nr:hypothetical protein [Pseudomonas cichorii]MBX8498123.1 hypothetical protein [Pseudomonas cichorii]
MLEVKRLKLVAKTSVGDYGVDIPFSYGLFILRVENTHGKSTCMNAIAYALGMEKALGLADVKLPFPPSLTKEIQDENGIEMPVISSMVLLEIGNGKGEVATIRRQILGVTEENATHVHPGSIDTVAVTTPQKLFLHREGDTTRSMGFYYWLSRFVGWDLPSVPTVDGREAPLYPAVFFPAWFVEQKKGWGAIQATTPLFLKIREAKKRSIEFLLALETNAIIKKKHAIKTSIDDLSFSWKFCKKNVSLAAARISGEVTGIPDAPEASFDPYKIDIAVKSNDKWRSIQFLKSETEAALDIFLTELQRRNNEKVKESKVLDEIDARKTKIRSLTYSANSIEEDVSYSAQQIQSVTVRIDRLKEDRRKYEDLKKIGQLEILKDSSLGGQICPACSQGISDNLVNLEASSSIMSLDESLNYIKEQAKLVESIKSGLELEKRLKVTELDKLNFEISSLFEEVSRLQKDVMSPDSILMEENLRKKINLENLIKSYSDGIATILQARLELDKHVKEYRRLIEARRKLPQNILSMNDSAKLEKLRHFVVELLADFGFSSFNPELIQISEETYLPTREGFDLGFDTSASDGIRVIWSYLIGMFKLSKVYSTNHPQVLIFDEPRQQEAKKVSFTKLLKESVAACVGGGQIILATSEDEDVLVAALGSSSYTLRSFPATDGKILRRL